MSERERVTTSPAPQIAAADGQGWPDPWVESFLRCPACHGEALARTDDRLACRGCGQALRLENGLLVDESPGGHLRMSDDDDPVARKVREFYEAHPFPNYDGFESVGDLLSRASRSVYAAVLDHQIPLGARILEAGCGTGQLGIFLSIGGRSVVGVDLSSASLRMALEFKRRHRLNNCNFLQADLFNLPLRSEAFDLVISKGVLHHTADARRAFQAICRMVRPGGYVILGLYNRIGRIPTSVRRIGHRLFRGDYRSTDYVLRKLIQSDDKARSWFLDQYAHPHETRHTVDEVLGWLDENGLDYVSSAPPIRFGAEFSAADSLFRPVEPGNRFEHWLTQVGWIVQISREGALFDTIARKRSRT